MSQGFVKIYRKLLDNPISNNPKCLSLWITLLLLANHEDNKFLLNNKIITIKKGQLITGRDKLAKQTGINRSSVERMLGMLEREHQIEQQKTTKFRILTIVNWKEYQKVNNKVNNKRATSEQQVSTNNNDNNDNNILIEEREEHTLDFLMNIPLESIKEFSTKFNCYEAEIRNKGEDLYNYCLAKGKKYKNYKAFLRNALKKDFGFKRNDNTFIPKQEIKPDLKKLEELREIKNKINFKI